MKRHNDIIMRSPRVKIKLKKIILRCELCNKFPFPHCSQPIIATRMLSFCGKRISHSYNYLMSLYIYRERCKMSRSPLHFREGRDEYIVDVLLSPLLLSCVNSLFNYAYDLRL